jgi:SAM-dependent MidA family methyltransferase
MSDAIRDRIVDEIGERGPMPFDRYMDLCLYDPRSGFFGSGRGTPGVGGDFVTSPEVSERFGELVAGWAIGTGVADGTPLIEVGAGSGAMLGPLTEAWRGIGPVCALERSASARDLLAERFPDVTIGGGFDDLPASPAAVVVGNEVLDNMPAALARSTDSGWSEVAVGGTPEALTLVDVPARDHVVEWCEGVFGHPEPGRLVAVQRGATEWVRDLVDRYERLHACLIDYGEPAAVLLEGGAERVVRAYRRHRAWRDWIDRPATTDLTVDVNIDAVVDAAASAGASVRVVDQSEFLGELGALAAIEDAAADERAAAEEGRIMDQLAARSQRVDLGALLDPAGFGAFRVFVIESGV